MTNTIRSIAALLVAPIVLACALLSACAPTAPAQSLRLAMTGPNLVANALVEEACADLIGERESTHFEDCVLAANDARCEREGWCD